MKLLTLAGLALIALAPAHAADPKLAPYGFIWGQTQDQVKALGIGLENCEKKDTDTVCDAKTVPKPPAADIEFYRLRFDDKDGGLAAVSFSGATISGDADGTKGKAIYETLRKALVADYGEGTRSEKDNAVFPGGLYACLDADACEWRSTWFDGQIVLTLNGLEAGRGYTMENFFKPF